MRRTRDDRGGAERRDVFIMIFCNFLRRECDRVAPRTRVRSRISVMAWVALDRAALIHARAVVGRRSVEG
jgi:hypothetical protein